MVSTQKLVSNLLVTRGKSLFLAYHLEGHHILPMTFRKHPGRAEEPCQKEAKPGHVSHAVRTADPQTQVQEKQV